MKFQLQSVYLKYTWCYDLNSILSKRYILVLSNTRKLNRVPTTI